MSVASLRNRSEARAQATGVRIAGVLRNKALEQLLGVGSVAAVQKHPRGWADAAEPSPARAGAQQTRSPFHETPLRRAAHVQISGDMPDAIMSICHSSDIGFPTP